MKFQIHKSSLIKELLDQEDTTNSYTITIKDKGPKSFKLKDDTGEEVLIKGSYHLANLLQEAIMLENETGEISLDKITEKPTKRLSRIIKDIHWRKLTRNIDKDNLSSSLQDDKLENKNLSIYVPETDKNAIDYFTELTNSFKNIKLKLVPKNLSQSNVKNLYKDPGILSLSFNKKTGKNNPYVVPGGRFNEMYGWDSYFIGIGLIIDDKFELAKAMIENLVYQIDNYGKILNANRNYYLTRSQPPFLTSFIREFYSKYNHRVSKDWLFKQLTTAIKEYENVWMTDNIRLTSIGLNRYFGEGKGIPQETEEGHFDYQLSIHAKKHNLSLEKFKEAYLNNKIQDPELDMYFVHDRSMRESGHDTTSRLDAHSANLAVVDLNSLLYKYETDFAYCIKHYFNDEFKFQNKTLTSDYWTSKANHRKKLIYTYLWHKEDGTFYDYNINKNNIQPYVSATNLYPLWSKICTKEEAEKLVNSQLKLLTLKGGVASTSSQMMTNDNPDLPKRQWDYPYAWAPHQMLIWQSLLNYDFNEKAQELIYRWLWLIVKTAVEYNGTIPEKFDVKDCTHEVNIEYGNVGTGFKYMTNGGFGWTNASYKLGISLLETKYINYLDELKDPDTIFKNK